MVRATNPCQCGLKMLPMAHVMVESFTEYSAVQIGHELRPVLI